jgi:GST-like protein
MITLYTWRTPNGRKIPIALEELGLTYELVPVDLTKNDQKSPWYLSINPNGKTPSIVDRDPATGITVTVFESAAILLYLAEKRPGLLVPTETQPRWEAVEWLAFQVSSMGPYFGLLGAALRANVRDEPAIAMYQNEVRRQLAVLSRALDGHEFLASSGFSVADIAAYPWMAALQGFAPGMIEEAPSVKAWMERLGMRASVKKAMAILA